MADLKSVVSLGKDLVAAEVFCCDKTSWMEKDLKRLGPDLLWRAQRRM